jgi:hypothetical protein
MQIILSDSMTLDGVVQSPGGRDEDTDGGFAHGGWSMPYFDPRRWVPSSARSWTGPTRCCSDDAPGRRWPRPGPSAPATPSPTR